MLPPNERELYVDALKPPVGYVLGEAVATTYSLDLATVLSVPLSLALPHLDLRKLGEESAISLLHAIRQVSSRLTIFCDRARIAAPKGSHVLYGLLEPVVHEVAVPHGGSLHAKVWLLRFEPDDQEHGEPVMRFVVMSRNLTFDRSWDVSVKLDGTLSSRSRSVNKPLVELLRVLPEHSIRPIGELKAQRLRELANEVSRTEWELPGGFEELTFHLLGTGKRSGGWLPAASSRLVVISPFVTAEALRQLTETTSEPVALISRAEELDGIDRKALAGFGAIYTLHEAAEREDGEDEEVARRETALHGLHAKVYLAKVGWNTHLYLGSANASGAALIHGQNIEFLVELMGKTSAVPGRGIEGMMSKDGLLEILAPYDLESPLVAPDPEQVRAEEVLRRAAIMLAEAPLSIRFAREGALYEVTLVLGGSLELAGVNEVSVWLATVDPSSASEAHVLFETAELSMQPCTPESATSFVAFRLMATGAAEPVTFVLNLPTTSLPVDRDAHVMRVVVNNRDRFLKYLLGLLEGFEADVAAGLAPGAGTTWHRTARGEAGLLERLVRTRARHPERLEHVRVLVDALTQTPEGSSILSEDFLSVWHVLSEVQP